MTTEKKFHAAVNVIRSLPKSGSYQPSRELMLRFYSYYKQATEGKCEKPTPGFWDLINRAKWEAWNKLGDMSGEEAMEAYVGELRKIVETMSYTDNVAAFLDAVEGDTPDLRDDLLLVAGDVLKKTASSPSTPKGSRDLSPRRAEQPSLNGREDSEDEYIDTVDSEESEIPARQASTSSAAIPNGHAPASAPAPGRSSGSSKAPDSGDKVLEKLRKTVACLERDVAQLKNRVSVFEKERERLERSFMWRRPSWWPFKDVSPALLAAIIAWPMVANRLVAAVRRRK